MTASSKNNTVYCQDTTLAQRYGVSRATIWRWVSVGRLPKPIKFSPGCTRWHMPSLEKFEQQAESMGGANYECNKKS